MFWNEFRKHFVPIVSVNSRFLFSVTPHSNILTSRFRHPDFEGLATCLFPHHCSLLSYIPLVYNAFNWLSLINNRSRYISAVDRYSLCSTRPSCETDGHCSKDTVSTSQARISKSFPRSLGCSQTNEVRRNIFISHNYFSSLSIFYHKDVVKTLMSVRRKALAVSTFHHVSNSSCHPPALYWSKIVILF